MQVIHPLTMRHIQSADIPLRIKNVKNPNGPGTMIYPSENSSTSSSRRISPDRRAFMDAHGYEGIEQSRRTPTAITSKTNIIVLNISPNGSANRFQFMSEVIGRLATAQVVPDLMCTSEQSMSFAIHSNSKTQQTDILTNVGNVTVLDDMAIVSVIGHKMKNMVGIAGTQLREWFIMSFLTMNI
jgi:aspartate kinase